MLWLQREPAVPTKQAGTAEVGLRPQRGLHQSYPTPQLKDEPQPHVRWALGFVMENPAPCRPSL